MIDGRNRNKPPRAGLEREALREKGQFWTPDWVAEAMVGYLIAGGYDTVFDPAVGAGSFFRAARTVAEETGRNIILSGTEIDSGALQQAREEGVSESDLHNVQIRDFVLNPPKGPFEAIVANPPYIRHHRLESHVKSELRKFGASVIGKFIDGRAGLHIYFLLRALQLLGIDGRLAFIMPADTCEGVFSLTLWRWITNNYRLEAVITFAPQASPFPDIDTNPIIFMIKNAKPEEYFFWVKCTEPYTQQLKSWTLSKFNESVGNALSIHRRHVAEGLITGLSRAPLGEQVSGPILADFAKVLRGIATGANDFFFLTAKQASALGIPGELLVSAIGRTRDIPGNEIDLETIESLEAMGRPTLLFSPGGRPMESYPQAVREYLRRGEMMGINKRPLVATRRPWYKMEVRKVPPILFAYLGRRNGRFIRNRAGVVPLTGFLCVYPKRGDSEFIEKLWQVLQHPDTLAGLSLVGKSYGAGAIKVEPRALERLHLPTNAIDAVELRRASRSEQLQLI
jgi:adenine-specific DNA-methyltransferase